MEAPILLAAFLTGFVASRVGLPALVGYLIAGLGLSALGFESTEAIRSIGDLGILLLLFGIGLKLRVRTLLRPSVWGTAGIIAVVGSLVPALSLLALEGLGLDIGLEIDLETALVIGLALSFSSTVFAVKAMERTDEAASIGGRIAIGILIFQDVLAVAYLALSVGEWPSLWALAVIPGYFVLKPLFAWVIERSGHGEVLVLLGLTLAVGVGATAFELVGLKPELGALAAGLSLSGHPRASELADSILSIKDLLLIGFFLSIGLVGLPTSGGWLIAVAALVLLPLRSVTLGWLLTRFRLRSRTALHTSLTLSSYSEFGLVVVVAAGGSVISREWIPTVGVAVAGSMIVASIVSSQRYQIYDRWFAFLSGLERSDIVEDDSIIDFDYARVLIFGMGRLGTGAYDELVKLRQGRVVGVERQVEVVAAHARSGRNVIRGDALDRDFWDRIRLHSDVELVVAAMSTHAANIECVRRVRQFLPTAAIASIAGFRDQVADLHEAGVDVARNLYEEAGQALADDAVKLLSEPSE